MDDALFLNNVIQNILVELPRLAVNANERSTGYKTPQYSTPTFTGSFSRAINRLWLSPSDWEHFSNEVRCLKTFVFEHWNEFSEDDKAELIKLCTSTFSGSPKSKSASLKRRSVTSFVKSISLAASSSWASFILKKDVLNEILVEAEECFVCVLKKAQQSAEEVDSDYYPSNVLVLSDADSESFLASLNNPPEPSKELISLFSE